jgi:biotin/methionine sulfoxide reductase
MLLSSGGPFDDIGVRRRYPDIRFVYWAGGNSFNHHQDMHRLACAACRPETVVVHVQVWTTHAQMADITARLGAAYAFTEGRDARGWPAHLCAEAAVCRARAGVGLPDFETYWDAGGVRIPERPDLVVFFVAFRADPVAHVFGTPNGRIAQHSKRIASFDYDDCPGHPSASSPPNRSTSRSARAIRCTCRPISRTPRCTASPATPSTAS